MFQPSPTTLLGHFRWFACPSNRFVLVVNILGAMSLAVLVVSQGWGSLPLVPLLGFGLASSLMCSFPYRVNGPRPYYLDFQEILLVVALLYLSAPGIVVVLLVGNLAGSLVRRAPLQKILFNTGARASAASLGLAAVPLLPNVPGVTANYLFAGAVAGLIFVLLGVVLVIRMVSLVGQCAYLPELLGGLRKAFLKVSPMGLSYGLLAGLASMITPFALIIAALPVVLMVIASRRNQMHRDEYRRMSGLYAAAQRMHDAGSSDEVLVALQDTIRETLGVEGAVLRTAPPMGDELGSLLRNRKEWLVLPEGALRSTRKQDEAFLQAIGSLADAGLERASVMDELERQSLRDPLTNAYNRRYFLQALSNSLGVADEQPGCLALIDIDHFKAINDTFGHEAGDDALRKLVSRVEGRFRTNDQLCRIGGDEFALILPGLDVGAAVERLEGLRRELEGLRLGSPAQSDASLAGAVLGRAFEVSIGVAVYPLHSRDPKVLLSTADRALYQAKRNGRNCVVIASPERMGSANDEHYDEVVGNRNGEEMTVDPV